MTDKRVFTDEMLIHFVEKLRYKHGKPKVSWHDGNDVRSPENDKIIEILTPFMCNEFYINTFYGHEGCVCIAIGDKYRDCIGAYIGTKKLMCNILRDFGDETRMVKYMLYS